MLREQLGNTHLRFTGETAESPRSHPDTLLDGTESSLLISPLAAAPEARQTKNHNNSAS